MSMTGVGDISDPNVRRECAEMVGHEVQGRESLTIPHTKSRAEKSNAQSRENDKKSMTKRWEGTRTREPGCRRPCWAFGGCQWGTR
jgi:hypothetical protein